MKRFWCRNCNHSNSNDLNGSNPIILDMFGQLHPNTCYKLLQKRGAILDSGVAIHSAAAHPDEVIHIAPLQLGKVSLLQI